MNWKEQWKRVSKSNKPIIDLLLNIKGIKDHPQMEDTPEWNMKLRIFCILLWPLSILLFIIACLTSFLSSIFKK